MDIYEFNPWWETGSISREIASFRRRTIFKDIKDSLGKRRIDVIVGLRRVGKTVLMHQLIGYLLENGVEPRRILYFSFDLERKDLKGIISEYEEKVLKGRLRDERAYLFLDEVHKLEDWENKVKTLYDLYPEVKIVLSGSASLNLLRSSRESLAGRAKFHYMPPLSFREFLRLSGEAVPGEQEFNIREKRLRILLNRFILRGFPETISMSDQEAREYVRELVVERVIYRDIPETFGVEDREIVRLLAEYVFENPGVVINVDSLSRDLGRHRRTIRNALAYLELSFLIVMVSNVRGSFLAESRKNKKAYPIHPSLAFTRDEGRILETLVRSELDARHYWRKGASEVDFVLKNSSVIPVEVKNKERVDKSDLKGLIKFLKLFNSKLGYLVNMGEERMIELDDKKIAIVPTLKFILVTAPSLSVKLSY